MPNEDLPIVVIGAGPIGLTTAVYLQHCGLDFIVLEKRDKIAGAVSEWQHVALFSPWKRNVDELVLQLFQQHDIKIPDLNGNPTGTQFIDEYLVSLAGLPEIAPHIQTGVDVRQVAKAGADKMNNSGEAPFIVRVQTAEGEQDILARGVIDASGTWDTPNPLGATGIPAIGELEANDFIAGTLPDILGHDKQHFANKRVLVVGNGYSAANSVLSLAELVKEAPDTKIYWAVRNDSVEHFYNRPHLSKKATRWKIGESIRRLVEQPRPSFELLPNFALNSIVPENDAVKVAGETSQGEKSIVIDTIVSGTGFRPNLEMHRELHTNFDHVSEAPANMLEYIRENRTHPAEIEFTGVEAVSHPQPNFYVIGMKSHGRMPGFFLYFGYEQAKAVAAAFAGDKEAAGTRMLKLPWNVEQY